MQSWWWDQAAFKCLSRHRCLITLCSSVIRRSDALKALLACCVPPEWGQIRALADGHQSITGHGHTHTHRGAICLYCILYNPSCLRSKNKGNCMISLTYVLLWSLCFPPQQRSESLVIFSCGNILTAVHWREHQAPRNAPSQNPPRWLLCSSYQKSLYRTSQTQSKSL